jgi:hypothetical protein
MTNYRKIRMVLSRLVLPGLLLTACGGSSGSNSNGTFSLIEFLEGGQNSIPRNRQVQFRFSDAVQPDQDLSARLKIQNVVQEPGNANFARAAGTYLVNGEIVVFTPRLPTRTDRSDAGFKQDGNYAVFISAGGNGLASQSGDRVSNPQEFRFETNQFFEDVIPDSPPRSGQLVGLDATTDAETDLSRLDPRPFELSRMDNATLIAAGRVVTPGTGNEFGTPWHFDLKLSEPIDPTTVNGDTVQMFEIYSDATTTAPATATPDHFGTPVSFRVAADITTIQGVDDQGSPDIRVRITPLQTLVDNTRYRIVLSGQVLGIDFRKTFAGDNGLTGDGETRIDGARYDEPGGLGYVTEFIVSDHPSVSASRKLQYDPILDGINPEEGQTTLDPEAGTNSALYNPAAKPGTAVGFLSAFGNGVDGPLAITGTAPTVINTGDVPNEPLGNPFSVMDLNPEDDYLSDTRPGGMLDYDSVEPFTMELESLTISSSSTLRVIGVNPVLFRVAGIVQIAGTLDVSGEEGDKGGASIANGGQSGAGGFDGADAKQGAQCRNRATSCSDFDVFLNACSAAKAIFPASLNGEGPGRGLAGGEAYPYYAVDGKTEGPVGTGGGGGSHATEGTKGEDRLNASGAVGTAGPSCSAFLSIRNSGVIGVRGMSGPGYGDRELVENTMGGSGGGAGGSLHTYQTSFTTNQAGGGGGGGGGSVTIVAAGSILAQGAQIDASGGAGGKGGLKLGYTFYSWESVSGAGGGGSGGTIALISGDSIDMTGSVISAEGGVGGLRANSGTTKACSTCNAGGNGGLGYIFLMDSDGQIDGFAPTKGGEYNNDTRGILTIRSFDATRFSAITAVTELFPMTAANPAYQNFSTDPMVQDIVGFVNADQSISVVVSSARSDLENPLMPDLGSEMAPFEVARLDYAGGSTVVTVIDDMSKLNVDSANPDREAFVRVQARFNYQVGVQAALGPFAAIDEVTIRYDFN